MKDVTVICTSVGNDGFPSIANALHEDPRIYIVGCDTDCHAPGFFLADKIVVVPSRKQTTSLLHSLIECRRDGVNILMPLSTEDQDFFAQHKKFLEHAGIHVLVARGSALSIANDKHALYAHCNRNGFPLPEYCIANNADSAVAAILEYARHEARCVMKLARGTGAQGVKIIDPQYDDCAGFWDRDKLTVSVDMAITWLQKCNMLDPVLVTEYLPGVHLSVDAIKTEDGFFQAACRTEEMHLYGLAIRGEIVDNPNILKLSRSIMDSLGLTGACNLEFRLDLNSVPKLLEINPRFGGSVGHTVAAGVNLPLSLVRSALGEKIKESAAKPCFRFGRFWSVACFGNA